MRQRPQPRHRAARLCVSFPFGQTNTLRRPTTDGGPRQGFLAAGHYALLSEAAGCVGVGPVRLSAQQAHLLGPGYGLSAIGGAEFAVDVVDVRLDRPKRDEEIARDLGVGPAGGEKGEDLQLPLA
jgi:hypothetical protein